MADSPLLPVMITAAGAYLAWFGVHYWRSDVAWPTDPIKAVLTGEPLPDNTPDDAAAIGATGGAGLGAAAGAAVGNLTGTGIKNNALKYKGSGYVFGGNASSIGDWDCSSFVSKVVGEDCGFALPGGGRWGDPGYPPHAHGPTTLQYMLYGTGVDLGQVRAGDLIVSVEHIGIAISTTQMISAQDPQSGTNISAFPAGFPAGPPVYRRISSGP